jgi:hypothetical protein
MAKTHKKGGKRKLERKVNTTRTMRTMRTMRTTHSTKRRSSKNVKRLDPMSKSIKEDTTHKSSIIISNLEKKRKGKLYNINYRSFSHGASFNVE